MASRHQNELLLGLTHCADQSKHFPVDRDLTQVVRQRLQFPSADPLRHLPRNQPWASLTASFFAHRKKTLLDVVVAIAIHHTPIGEVDWTLGPFERMTRVRRWRIGLL